MSKKLAGRKQHSIMLDNHTYSMIQELAEAWGFPPTGRGTSSILSRCLTIVHTQETMEHHKNVTVCDSDVTT